MAGVTIIFGLLLYSAFGAIEHDIITNLPGLVKLPTFKQYSGYLTGSTDNFKLHYWFVESQRSPKNDPLVLWLNGGPGCSSIEDFVKGFPEFSNHDFYITGESYGGVYVPTLALRVIEGGKLKLKLSKFNSIINSGLDIYNLYAPCAGGVTTLWKNWATTNKGFRSLASSQSGNYYTSDFGNLFRSNIIVQSRRNRMYDEIKRSNANVNLAIPCEDNSVITSYMNDQKVIAALNIAPNLPAWDVCSAAVSVQYVRTYQELSKQYTKILDSGVKTFIYNGDIDMACNFLGDQWFVDSLGLPVKAKRRSWLYTEDDNTKQIGGFVKEFYSQKDKRTVLTYLTVRGAGHMVPTDKPLQAYKMFSSFLNGTEL